MSPIAFSAITRVPGYVGYFSQAVAVVDILILEIIGLHR